MIKRMMILAMIVCGLVTACGRREEENQQESGDLDFQEEPDFQEEAGTIADSWQQAYVEYLQSAPGREDAGGYTLIYVDNDDIPELVDIGGSEAEGTRLISFPGGKIQETQLSRTYFTYLERGGLFCNSDGNMDCYWDLVYQIQDGQVTQVGSGYYGIWQYYEEDREVDREENGMPIYLYEWNGEKVTEEAYSEALYALYDLERAVPGYSYEDGRYGYSADEMTEILENWEG